MSKLANPQAVEQFSASDATRDRLLYIDEVAEMIRRSPAALRAMIHKGDAPTSAKIGGRRVFRESMVIAWIDAQFEKETA